MIAVGQDAKALFTDDGLFPDDISTNATRLLLAALDGERSLHLTLVLLDALLGTGKRPLCKVNTTQSKVNARQVTVNERYGKIK